ncbi:HNH endonuclease [Levilactobacillus sp. N40-8-2]|uniref:HNH endonuclease n=1 Tax=Levilactobacillus muriae TaxID=3238987 RepID=UPI0038B2DD25
MKTNFDGVNENNELKEVPETKKAETEKNLDVSEKLDESKFDETESADVEEGLLEGDDYLDVEGSEYDWDVDDLTIDDLENIEDEVKDKPWQEIPLPNFVYKAKLEVQRLQSVKFLKQEQQLGDGTYKGTPSQNSSAGHWSGSRGDSTFVLNPEYIPQNTKMNPEHKSYQELGVSEIKYKKGEPIFKEVAKDSEKIEMSMDRSDNFRQADQLLADKWGWTIQEVKEYREDNHLTWHERQDMKTIDLVPSAINGSLSHAGGVAFIKRDNESLID